MRAVRQRKLILASAASVYLHGQHRPTEAELGGSHGSSCDAMQEVAGSHVVADIQDVIALNAKRRLHHARRAATEQAARARCQIRHPSF